MRSWAALGALAVSLHAGLPPAVESLRPSIQSAERRLQDVSLEFQAAKHAAEPWQGKVAEARAQAQGWWGRWVLKRRLGQLKTSLDRVENARAGLASARQELALLLTGADEELSAALEASLNGYAPASDRALRAKWRQWWFQKRTWQQRLDALAPAQQDDDPVTQGSEAVKIRHEALQAQWDREKGILEVLGRRKALDARELKAERRRLEARLGPAKTPGP